MSRGPGKPPVGPRVEIRFPQDVLDAVDAAARANGETRPAFIRRAVAEALERARRTRG